MPEVKTNELRLACWKQVLAGREIRT